MKKEERNTEKLKFETLLKGNAERSYETKWYPKSVSDYKAAFKIEKIDKNEALLKNIAYNMQYLEFIEKEFKELEISSVLERMLTKTYVITSASIIEGLFLNLINSKGWKSSSKIKFVDMINIIEEKYTESSLDIETIHKVRQLRNRIHLQKSEANNISDHDYNTFDTDVKLETQKLLYEILTSPDISEDITVFDFLKPVE